MWTSLKFFVGEWEGKGAGQPGHSDVVRSYEFVLGGTFLQVKNRSTYPPQDQNPKGEIHEDLGLIGFDKARQVFVLRQFHCEGFVNQYLLGPVAPDGRTMVFTTESIENIAPGWRARETYQILNPDEFTETFELAAPDKEFELYANNHFRRRRPMAGSVQNLQVDV